MRLAALTPLQSRHCCSGHQTPLEVASRRTKATQFSVRGDRYNRYLRPNRSSRVNKEIDRRPDVVDIYPNDQALILLAAIRPIEQNDEFLGAQSDERSGLPDAFPVKPSVYGALGDGASRARTGDLLGAIQALSQLSYSPGRRRQPLGPASVSAPMESLSCCRAVVIVNGCMQRCECGPT